MTLLELAEAVIRVTDSESEIVFAALPVDDPQVRQLDITRARQILAWLPEVELEEACLVLALRLLAEGAHVKAWDPVAIEDARPHLAGVELCEDLLAAVTGANAAVIVTEWSDLKALPRPEVRTAMKNPLIVDGRNLLDPETVRQAGFAYEGIGRPSSPVEGRLDPQPTRARRSVGSLPRRGADGLTTGLVPRPAESERFPRRVSAYWNARWRGDGS